MKKPSQLLSALALGLVLAAPSVQAADIEIASNITSSTNWSATNVYILRKMVFVETNATLTIEAGTLIRAETNTVNMVSSAAEGLPDLVTGLWITRGAKLNACGTPCKPIIFTVVGDDLNDPNDIPLYGTRVPAAAWGGVVLLGDALINSSARGVGGNGPGTKFDVLEGTLNLNNNVHTTFGGTNDNDSSGILKYVSIRYPGREFAAGSELNGLTMGAVGKGTTIEHVEVYAGTDDGFEWWGGCVDSKYLVAAFCSDDSFDTDQGYRGRNQFWFAIQEPSSSDYMMELDGEVNPSGNGSTAGPTPLSLWSVHNFTGIGDGAGVGRGIWMGDETQARVHNSAIVETQFGAHIQNDNIAEWAGGLSWISNTVAQSTTLHEVNAGIVGPISAANGFALGTAGITSISRTNNFGLNPAPASSSVLLNTSAGIPADGFYSQVPYRGAFAPNENWMCGWTALDGLGFLNRILDVTEITEVDGKLCLNINNCYCCCVYLQCSTSLTTPDWQTIQVVRAGVQKVTLDKTGDTAKFYRLCVVQ